MNADAWNVVADLGVNTVSLSISVPKNVTSYLIVFATSASHHTVGVIVFHSQFAIGIILVEDPILLTSFL